MAASDSPVSVIVLNWNGSALLPACLDALAAQVWHDFEVLVVDNGSTDGSPELLARQYPWVKVIRLERNMGFCGGNNAGIGQARGAYIALLNNDTEVEERWLEELVGALDTNPDVGFCASKMVLQDRPGVIDSAGDAFSIAGTARKTGHRVGANTPRYNERRHVFGACAGAALYRRSMLDDIGVFDEDFFIAQEDVDLSFRAQLRGYTCLYVPTAVVRHRLNATLKTWSPEYVYYGHRNLEYVYLKNMPAALLVLTFPFHLLDVLLSLGFFLVRGQGRAYLRAKRDALRALPQLLRKRKVIQRRRTVSSLRILRLLDKSWPWTKMRRLVGCR